MSCGLAISGKVAVSGMFRRTVDSDKPRCRASSATDAPGLLAAALATRCALLVGRLAALCFRAAGVVTGLGSRARSTAGAGCLDGMITEADGVPPRAMTSIVSSKDSDGHADTARLTRSGRAAKTLATMLADTPRKNANHADSLRVRPSTNATEATTTRPSTESGSSAASAGDWPAAAARSRMCAYETTAAMVATVAAPAYDASLR